MYFLYIQKTEQQINRNGPLFHHLSIQHGYQTSAVLVGYQVDGLNSITFLSTHCLDIYQKKKRMKGFI